MACIRNVPAFIAAMLLILAPIAPPAESAPSSDPSPDSLVVQLLFNGRPLPAKDAAKFSCYDYQDGEWINCRIRPTEGLQRYAMARPADGQYRMHILLDDNEDNPDSYPGDYEKQHRFVVGPDVARTLHIDVPRIIHLTAPADNGRSLEHAFDACEREPEQLAPFLSFPQTAPVEFSWHPLVDGAEYRVSVIRTRCEPYERLETLIERRVSDSNIVLNLKPNEPGEHYQFLIEGFKQGRVIGVLLIHDAGTHGWDYRFRVALEKPNPQIAVVASLGAVFVFFLVSLAFMLRSGNRSLAGASLAVVLLSGWLGYQAFTSYREDHRESRTRIREAELTAAELRQSLNEIFVGEWTAKVPIPHWWNDVTPPDYPIDNVGELMSAWQSDFGRGETRIYRERQFFKGAYQAIVAHPADSDLVSTAIDLMAFIGRDYPHRRALLSFGVKHFFDYDRPTDNCVGCMPGDRANSMVVALADIYVRAGAHEEAISLIERFRSDRREEVSDYAWAETITVLGKAYWESGAREKAITVMREESHIPGDHPYVQRMRKQFDRFERELADD